MDSVAEGLWSLADSWEEKGKIAEAIKCLEAICQSQVSFLPIIDVKTRLRVSSLLLRHSDNVMHAKAHLERAYLLLKQIPACFELKCRAYSLLSRCYYLLGTIPPLKQTLKKALDLTDSAEKTKSVLLWACNFRIQLSNALTTEGDHETAIQVLESGLLLAEEARVPHLQLMFTTSILHVYLMQWQDDNVIGHAIVRCERLWNLISAGTLEGERLAKQVYKGLYIYKEMLHTFFCLRSCDYSKASYHADCLDEAMLGENMEPIVEGEAQEQLYIEILRQLKQQLGLSFLQHKARAELQARYRNIEQQLEDLVHQRRARASNGTHNLASSEAGALSLGPAPLNEEWLPRGAVLVLIDLLKVLCMRPKGMFKECHNRIHKGLSCVEEELAKYSVTDQTAEANLEHWAIWIVGVYLVLRIQLLESKLITDLTQTDLLAAQEDLLKIIDCFRRFPTMLQGCESSIHMLLGHYAQSMRCYQDAAAHFVEASKLTDSKGMQAMSQVNAALSFICLDDLSQALDLIGPVYRNMDSYVGVREKASVLFTSGFLRIKQGNFQDARAQLTAGLTITHKQLGNHQLLSQYLTLLGGMATMMNDTGQARDILKSSFTLSKGLQDLPTQVGALSELAALWRVLGDSAKEEENAQYSTQKAEELAMCIDAALESVHHTQLLEELKHKLI